MVQTLERPTTVVKSTYTPPNPKPLLPDLDPKTEPQETEAAPEATPAEETTAPAETEEAS